MDKESLFTILVNTINIFASLEDVAIQQMITNMQETLKRVPPEVASTIQLQSALEQAPHTKKSRGTFELPVSTSFRFLNYIHNLSFNQEKLEKITQTSKKPDEYDQYRKVMEESTVKLEESCKQMEKMCTSLKNEKDELEKQLGIERDSINHLKKRVEELEVENVSFSNKLNSLF